MRELTSIQQVGNEFGDATWQLYCLEHNLNNNGELSFNLSDDAHNDFCFVDGQSDYISYNNLPIEFLEYELERNEREETNGPNQTNNSNIIIDQPTLADENNMQQENQDLRIRRRLQ